MSAGDWLLIGALAALLVIGSKGTIKPAEAPKVKPAKEATPAATAWLWRGG